MTTACSFPGCPRPYHSHGLCSAHADQRRRGTALKPVRGADPKPCSFPDCGRIHFGHGLCKTHMAQKDRGVPLTPIRPTAARGEQPPCSAPCGCDRKADAKGLCKAHYQQKRAGKELVPIGARKPRGERAPRRAYVRKVRTPRPASVLPKGWDRKAAPTATPAIAGGVKELGPVKPTGARILAAALETLAARDALDLAECLGLVA